MNQPSDQRPTTSPEDHGGISRWARAYAQNRSLGVVVFMVVFVVLCAAIGVPSYLAGQAYRSGNIPLFWGSIVMLVPAVAAVICFSVPQLGGRLQERVVQRLYDRDGSVGFSPPAGRQKLWGAVLGSCFGCCVLASVMLDFALSIPFKYMQPISALYVVPFLVGVWVLMRPMASPLVLLWPGLYALHAILIVAGAPILFTGPWEGLNMLIPIAGYGILAGLAGHLYGRFALHRLKRLARADLEPDEVPQP